MPRGPPSKGQAQLKVVVRRLPPTVPEHIVWQTIDAVVENEATSKKKNIDWRSFIPGKVSSSKHKEATPSVAYLHFTSAEALVAFSRAYQGHLFKDKQGHLHEAQVEFAPFQRVPRSSKPDPKQSTLQDDPDYKSFLENPDSVIAAAESTPEVPAPNGSTPLISYLKDRAEQKSAAKSKKAAAAKQAATVPSPPAKDTASKKAKEKKLAKADVSQQPKILSKDGKVSETQPVVPSDTTSAVAAAVEGSGTKGKSERAKKNRKKENKAKGGAADQPPSSGQDKKPQLLQSKGQPPQTLTDGGQRSTSKPPSKQRNASTQQKPSRDGSRQAPPLPQQQSQQPALQGKQETAKEPRRSRLNPNNRLLNAALGGGTSGKRGGRGGSASTATGVSTSTAPAQSGPT